MGTGMDSSEFFATRLGASRSIAIFRGQSPSDTVRSCRRAWDSGIELVEIPIQGVNAGSSLVAAIDAAGPEGRIVGAGSLRTAADIDTVIAAGARFGVTAGISGKLLAHAGACSFPLLPGVATASEIMLALSSGTRWLKMFPASVLGPAWVRAQLSVFPEARFVATGGVTERNAQEFLAAGCRAIAASEPLGIVGVPGAG